MSRDVLLLFVEEHVGVVEEGKLVVCVVEVGGDDWGSFYGSDVVPSECILYMFDVYDRCDCDGMFVSDILLYPSVLSCW